MGNRFSLVLLGSLCAIALPLAGAVAQTSPNAVTQPASPRVPATDLPKDGIPLSAPGASGRHTAEWTKLNGGRRLINTTQPMLDPILPAPNKRTGAAVIVAPGGGFVHLAIDKEGWNVGRWLADHGIAAFVLRYRTRPYDEALAARRAAAAPSATPGSSPAGTAPATAAPTRGGGAGGFGYGPAADDARAALRLVRERATEFGIDPDRIGMMGFSAGAGLTLEMGIGSDVPVRPSFIAPIYGSMAAREITADAPPMFVAIAADDNIFSSGDIGLIRAWQTAKRPVEFHLYEKGGHGFGVPGVEGTTTTAFMDQFYLWMKSRGLLAKAAR